MQEHGHGNNWIEADNLPPHLSDDEITYKGEIPISAIVEEEGHWTRHTIKAAMVFFSTTRDLSYLSNLEYTVQEHLPPLYIYTEMETAIFSSASRCFISRLSVMACMSNIH